jgi:hypothetical protein
MEVLATARIAALSPGQSPPPVKMPILLVRFILFLEHVSGSSPAKGGIATRPTVSYENEFFWSS